MTKKVELEIARRKLVIETGKMAKQADGTVTIRYGDTMVLVAVVASQEAKENVDFFPLTVDYRESTYAVGKIPGGFFKREGRPRDWEILAGRLTDRPLRPLFPEGFRNEVQITVNVLSADGENEPEILSIIGASAALSISDIPFNGPVAAVRLARLGQEFIVNPTYGELERSNLNMVVAGTKEAIATIEVEAHEVPEEIILQGIEKAKEEIGKVIEIQEKLVKSCGRPKRKFILYAPDKTLETKVRELTTSKLEKAYKIKEKSQREEALNSIEMEAVENLAPEFPDKEKDVKFVIGKIEKEILRQAVLNEKRRIDGRRVDEVRPITCDLGILPRAHGSALFTRGQTQALVTTTLGTTEDEQIIDALEKEFRKSFLFHYNFPPFSVGEARRMRGPGRREIGHGALAEKAIMPIIPPNDKFPYTIRIVSDILESNGSSSMASICGASLSLMDAGVPIKTPVAGAAIGVVMEKDKYVLLTDILGVEDALGDMDFKIAGTKEGITALHLDIKTSGITLALIKEALEQARKTRLFILDEMNKAISQPREGISAYAPHIIVTHVKQEKIGGIIGPGGRTIKGIIEETGAEVNIDDDGKVSISSPDEAAAQAALNMVNALVEEVEVGKIYKGKVTRIMNFGAFVEILPGKEGLIHVSQLAEGFVKNVTDVVKEGQEVEVKVIEIDDQKRINLSRKVVLEGKAQPKKHK
jgi:polyribonucleotide nucleotidyltransferase